MLFCGVIAYRMIHEDPVIRNKRREEEFREAIWNEERLIVRYDLESLQLIGEGGTGMVFDSRSFVDESEGNVAIKVVKKSLILSRDFEAESHQRDLLLKLNHEHIVKVIEKIVDVLYLYVYIYIYIKIIN